MKSNLRNMLLSLTGITVAAAVILGVVNVGTEKPIADSMERSRNEAIAAVIPAFDTLESTAADDGEGHSLTVHEAFKDGVRTGTAVETFSDNGFGGRISIIAGFDADGRISGYRVLQHAETPGLGANMEKWFMEEGSAHNVIGSGEALSVKNDGGSVDAITGATITSRAFLEAINRARRAAKL